MKKAFTLAEIMIVLTVIGVITGILLPIAHNCLPNEKVMKFKKGHATLYKVINELVASDKYYLDGELGKKTDGSWVEDTDYFCQTFSDLITTKSVLCYRGATETNIADYTQLVAEDWEEENPYLHVDDIGVTLDEFCEHKTVYELTNKIVTSDNITYFETEPRYTFGINDTSRTPTQRFFYSVWDRKGVVIPTNYNSGNYYIYKPFCMDIDGINQGEDPFGYGIRIDGKIINGARVKEWLEKDIQDKD